MRSEVFMRCPICGLNSEVVSYHRDDPVLDCGHIVSLEAQGVRRVFIDEVEQLLLVKTRSIMHRCNVGYRRALELLWG
jgi:hypothetical protein